ncbi:MAG: TIM44-related membrane protein TimA [Alphaproteobacteria bacterium]
MNSSFELIIAFAVAAFLLWRLHSVLGTTHEGDQQEGPSAPNPYAPPPPPQGAHDAAPRRADAAPTPDEIHATSVNAGLGHIQAADPSFNEQVFLTGAEQAFAMIVTAFAKGDRETLRMLLADNLYSTFDRAITDRDGREEEQETEIDRIIAIDVREAELVGTDARVTVEIVSEQINVTRDKDGNTVAGHPDQLEEVRDIWSFTRDVSSRDPAWRLIETRAPAAN